jgi:3-hydroxyisobutyrate dehydrogenase-like beta-hydroxyacid dehydrogenase
LVTLAARWLSEFSQRDIPRRVFDIDRGALDRVVQRGARQVHSAGAAVSDITITLLPSSVEVRQAVLGKRSVELPSTGIDGDRSQRHRRRLS